jgi:hypothetical protein
VSPAAHALDRRLHDLRAAQAAVTAELADLATDGTYAFLAGGGRISGTTAATARPLLARVEKLSEGVAPLQELLDRVSALRDSGQVDHAQAIELVSLLNSPSIVIMPEPAPTEAMTPQAWLAEMGEACTALRAIVTQVDSAWRDLLPRLERASARADRLAAELPDVAAVADTQAAIAALPNRIVEDPLGAADELTQVEAALAAGAQTRTEVASLHDTVGEAADLLTELDALLDEGHEALERSQAEVAGSQGLLDPIDADVVNGERGLRPWLARLRRLVARGEVARAGKGLARWRELAEQTLAAARQVAHANAYPVQRRQELHGLMQAAKAKADAAGRGGDPKVVELAEQAHRALAVPCDLAVAEAHVEAYLDELRRSPTPAQASAPVAAPVGQTDEEMRA